ncbi:MAG: hypothetical protein ACLFTK_07725 [Anaerolineales bacterium]
MMEPLAEFDALVTYLYIVGGRAVNAPPPGALAYPAPRRANRARQTETLFILTVPNGTVRAQAATYQTWSQQVADAYFKTSGSITNGLRDALAQLNKTILSEQKARMQPLRAGLIAAVMREQELYLARCGPMQGVYLARSTLATFPATRTAELLTLAPPLGGGMEPRAELTRFDLAAGAMLLLGDDSWLQASDDALRGALQSGADIAAVLDPLRSLVQANLIHGTLLQFVSEATPTPVLTTPAPAPPRS